MPKINRESLVRVQNSALRAMKDAVSGKPIEEGVRSTISGKIFEVLADDVPKALKKGLTVDEKIEKLKRDKVFMKLATAARWSDDDIAQTVQGIAADYYERKEKVATSEQERGIKIGRNEPCPCGSGKKYKKCCGR